MIYRSNINKTNFIQGLSIAWRRYFAQAGQLETSYEAAAQIMSQAYLDLLQDMKGVSLDQQEVFRQFLFHSYEISSAQCLEIDNPNPLEGNWFLFPLDFQGTDWKFKDINFIGNSLVAPTTLLERDIDYEIVVDGSTRLSQLQSLNTTIPFGDYILFFSDPGKDTGFPSVTQDEPFFNIVTPLGPVIDFPTEGIVVGDFLKLTFDAESTEYIIPISAVASNRLTFDTAYLYFIDEDLPRLANRGFKFEVISSGFVPKLPLTQGRFISQSIPTTSIPLWFSEAEVDDYALNEVYGVLLGVEETSTESYKSLLRGLLQYYVSGNSISKTTSAVHVIAGLPVFLSDGEEVNTINVFSGTPSIVTDQNVYLLENQFPIQKDVLFSARQIDGQVPDGTARWVTVPRNIDLRNRGVASGDKVVISDGTSEGVPYTATVLEVYNNQTLLLDAATPIPAGAAIYHGWSIGNNTANNNLFPLSSDVPLLVENFTRITSSEFEALDPLTSTVIIEDYLTYNDWWKGRLVPEALFPNQDIVRRSTTESWEHNRIGTTGLQIGDPQFFIGGDERGKTRNTIGSVIALPYFLEAPNTKDFREKEVISSMSGCGNGEGVLLYHDKARNLLFVRILKGCFDVGDDIQGRTSLAVAKLARPALVEISGDGPGLPEVAEPNIPPTDGVSLTQFSAAGEFGYSHGIVDSIIGDNQLRLYEHSTASTVTPGSVISVGEVSRRVTKVWDEYFSPARRNVAAFAMDNIWKYAILFISYDASSFIFPRGIPLLQELLDSGAEARTYIMIEPYSHFFDIIDTPEDTLDLIFSRVFQDTYGGVDNQLTIGGPGAGGGVWKIGETNYFIGGPNPYYTASTVETDYPDGGITDLPISIIIN